MPEGVLLTGSDLRTMVDNLCADGFSGYVKFELSPGKHAYVFVANGDQVRAFEMTEARGDVKVAKPDRLMNMAGGNGRVLAWSYILSGRLANVLGNSFAFKPLYRDYQVKKKELKKVLDNMTHDNHSGFLQFDLSDGRAVVVLEKGEPIHDQFISQYGEVLCGREVITNLFDYVYSQGAVVHVFAEKYHELENRSRRANDDLDKMIQLTVKAVGGMFASKDTLNLDLEYARGWGFNAKSTFQIAVEDMDGRMLGTYKAKGVSKKNLNLEIPQKIVTELGLQESQEVTVYPYGE